jgi:hypothetical protein
MPSENPDDSQKLTFNIPPSKMGDLRLWQEKIDRKVAVQQVNNREWIDGTPLDPPVVSTIQKSIDKGDPRPYYGMVGGAYRYIFTPNSLGVSIIVENEVTGDRIDLSEYELW